jgi:hypothetical protein
MINGNKEIIFKIKSSVKDIKKRSRLVSQLLGWSLRQKHKLMPHFLKITKRDNTRENKLK